MISTLSFPLDYIELKRRRIVDTTPFFAVKIREKIWKKQINRYTKYQKKDAN